MSEGLPEDTFEDIRSEPLSLTTTADRTVLGCMNDMAFMCKQAVG